jgi:hypothetical protein
MKSGPNRPGRHVRSRTFAQLLLLIIVLILSTILEVDLVQVASILY